MKVKQNLFGRVRLGYVLAETRRLDAWQRFARDGLGVHVDRPRADVLALRIDAHERRVVVCSGANDDVLALGWQLDDEQALAEIIERLRARRIEVLEGSSEGAQLRGVERYWSFCGPKKLSFELFTQARSTALPLQMRAGGFVTGEYGMGHVAITTREPQAMCAFFEEIFDARISDRIEDQLNGVRMDFTFMRLNARHHTIATAATRRWRMDPLRTSIHHLNLQARTLEDVTAAYRRLRAMGCTIANGMGQHPNDLELSFYVASPSGFEIEMGWNPIVVDHEDAWEPQSYRGISLWGHYPEGMGMRENLTRMGRSLASLARKEFALGKSE